MNITHFRTSHQQTSDGVTDCRGGQSLEMNLVTVYDIQNKFIAYSAPIPEVVDVLSEWGSLYVLAGDRRVGHVWRSRDEVTCGGHVRRSRNEVM